MNKSNSKSNGGML